MSLSSFCVVTNALRLNLFKVHDAGKDRKVKHPVGKITPDSTIQSAEKVHAEAKPPANASDQTCSTANRCISGVQPDEQDYTIHTAGLKKTLRIEGMMCGHCEARVKKALESVPGVAEASANHESGIAVVLLNQEVPDELLQKAVEEQDYEVLSIQ